MEEQNELQGDQTASPQRNKRPRDGAPVAAAADPSTQDARRRNQEDVDLGEVATKLNNQQLSLEASIRMIAEMRSLSLLNVL